MNIFKFDKDANIVEKVVTVFVPVAVLFLFGWLYLSVFGVFENNITAHALKASAFEHTIGFILLVSAIVWIVANAIDIIPFRVNDALIGVVAALLFVFSLCSYMGFGNGIY